MHVVLLLYVHTSCLTVLYAVAPDQLLLTGTPMLPTRHLSNAAATRILIALAQDHAPSYV